MERVGRGQAKLLLFGEHAAVYGYPALGIALPEAIQVRLASTGDRRWSFPDLAQGERRLLRDFLAYLEPILPAAAEEGWEVRVESSVPRGVGFGSSAALSAAFAEALSPPGTDRQRLWQIAHQAEHFFHGTPSGIDTGLSILHGMQLFRPAPPALPEATRLTGFPLHLVVGAVPRAGTTAGLVAELRGRLEAGDAGLRRRFELLGRITEQAVHVMEEGADRYATGEGFEVATAKLGTLVSSAHAILRELGLSTTELEKLLAAGGELGASGGKVSGAGGGGAFFLLFPSRESAIEASDHLADLARELSVPNDAQVSALAWSPTELHRLRRP